MKKKTNIKNYKVSDRYLAHLPDKSISDLLILNNDLSFRYYLNSNSSNPSDEAERALEKIELNKLATNQDKKRYLSSIFSKYRPGKVVIVGFKVNGEECFGVASVTTEYFFKNNKEIEYLVKTYILNDQKIYKAIRDHKLKKSFEEKVELMLRCLLKKDKYTAGHTKRVSQFSVLIAKELGLSSEDLYVTKYAGLLHDIGKIGIHDNILKKESPLDPSEFDIMKEHPVISSEILKGIVSSQPIIEGVKHHHEKFNGTGYPDGLKGDKIPLVARIISVADTFDALISHRPYRKATSPAKALEIISELSGEQLDPIVVQAFKSWLMKTSMLNSNKKAA